MIRDRKEALVRLHEEFFSRQEETGKANGSFPRHVPNLEDDRVIELCRQARNSAKFEQLYDVGDAGEYDHDASRADQALVSIFAFYTQDPDQLDRLFRGSRLYREEKWGRRSDYRRRTIEKALEGLRDTYSGPGGVRLHESENGHQNPSSPSLYKGSGRWDDKPKVVRFADMKLPGPRRYLLEGLVPTPYATLLYGDGGVVKSMLALALGLAVSGGSAKWLGRDVEKITVLYLDFELDAEEQARRINQLCCGVGLGKPPDGLLYMSALGYTARAAFEATLEASEEHGIKLLVLDSLGPALQGDAEASRDVISFFQQVAEPFRARGAPLSW